MRICTWAITIALAGLMIPQVSISGEGIDGNQMVKSCKNMVYSSSRKPAHLDDKRITADASFAMGFDTGVCVGLLTGMTYELVVEGIDKKMGICFNEKSNMIDMANSVVRYAEKNTMALNKDGTMEQSWARVTLLALMDAYPCR